MNLHFSIPYLSKGDIEIVMWIKKIIACERRNCSKQRVWMSQTIVWLQWKDFIGQANDIFGSC